MKINELKLWDKNPRGITKRDFEILKKRLKEKGQFKDLLINQDNIVLGGNMRLRAMRELGWTEAKVTQVETKNEQEMIWYALVDNEKSGYYEDEQLAELTIDLPDLGDIKIDLGKSIELGDLLDKFRPVEEDEVPEIPEGEPDSKLGEVYRLGRHRLMCGDSTKLEDVEKLMDGKKADMVFTDPPYNIETIGSFGSAKEKGKQFGRKYGDLVKAPTYQSWLGIVSDVTSENSVCLVFEHPKNIKGLWEAMDDYFKVVWPIIWHVPNRHQFWTQRWFYNKYDAILWGVRGDYTFRKKLAGSTQDVFETSKEIPGKGNVRAGFAGGGKPVKLLVAYINVLTNDGELVLDIFGGSGSTLIACEQLDRTCYMMEIDPKYCDVIRTRYKNYVSR